MGADKEGQRGVGVQRLGALATPPSPWNFKIVIIITVYKFNTPSMYYLSRLKILYVDILIPI